MLKAHRHIYSRTEFMILMLPLAWIPNDSRSSGRTARAASVGGAHRAAAADSGRSRRPAAARRLRLFPLSGTSAPASMFVEIPKLGYDLLMKHRTRRDCGFRTTTGFDVAARVAAPSSSLQRVGPRVLHGAARNCRSPLGSANRARAQLRVEDRSPKVCAVWGFERSTAKLNGHVAVRPATLSCCATRVTGAGRQSLAPATSSRTHTERVLLRRTKAFPRTTEVEMRDLRQRGRRLGRGWRGGRSRDRGRFRKTAAAAAAAAAGAAAGFFRIGGTCDADPEAVTLRRKSLVRRGCPTQLPAALRRPRPRGYGGLT